MSLAVSSDGYLLLSGSKDNTAILWSVGEGIHDIHKVYTAYGHAQSVSAVCLPRYAYMIYIKYIQHMATPNQSVQCAYQGMLT